MAGLAAAFPVVTWGVMELTVPKDGEVFKEFSPELQKKNLELRDERERDYQEFLDELKKHSKSEKPSMTTAMERRSRTNCRFSMD
ncbi:MAG: hypothetical protein Q9160_001039 [Pyrenula sp. 1 TL-2023]